MKTAAVSAALVGLAALATAQDLSGLPKCAQECAGDSLPANCGLDIECICTEGNFMQDVVCCVAQACSPEDQELAVQFANGICGGAGVTDTPQTAVCATGTASQTGSATSAPTSAPTSESGASETETESASPSETDHSSHSTVAEEATSTATEEAAPTETNAASALNTNGGVLAAIAAALVAFA
ncbi:hypothetical protein VTO42DRAFT_3914 [Malbranchea cinnamomea]